MNDVIPVKLHHLAPGRCVTITGGILSGTAGRVVRILEHRRRVRVEVVHQGRRVQVELRAGQVEAGEGSQ